MSAVGRRVGNTILNIATLVATVVLLMVAWDRIDPRPPHGQPTTSSELVPNPVDYAGGEIRLGQDSGAVRIVEFSDFACPYCARATGTIHRLLNDSDVRIVFEYRHLLGHQNSARLASAGTCAFRSGQFMRMHDYLFMHPDVTDDHRLAVAAESLGIAPAVSFEACMSSDSTIRSIRRDTLAVRRLGVTGTPTLVVHNRLFGADPGYTALRAVIDTVRAAGALRAAGDVRSLPTGAYKPE